MRLDEKSERILAEVRQAKKLTVSAALKEGLVALSDSLASDEPAQTPYSIYRTIDLGAGGRSRGAGRDAKSALQAILRRKTRDFADASLVAAAEALRTTSVFTLDRRDFSSYRAKIGRAQKRFSVLDPARR